MRTVPLAVDGLVGAGAAGRVVAAVVVAVVAVGRGWDAVLLVVEFDPAGEPPAPVGDVVASPVSGEPPPAADPSPSACRASSAVSALGWLSVTLRPTRPTPCQASRMAIAAAATHPIP